MNDQNDLLKIGEFSTGWHSHSDGLDAAKWLQDHSFSDFLDVVDSVLSDFSRLFELRADNESGEYHFFRRSDSASFTHMFLQSKVQLLHFSWDVARGEPKAKALNEFDGRLIQLFGREINTNGGATAFFDLSHELAKHRARIAMCKSTWLHPWNAEDETAGREILAESPKIKVKDFCRIVGVSDDTGGKLYHHIKGTKPERRNRS